MFASSSVSNTKRVQLPMKHNRASGSASACEICTYPSHGLHFGVVSCRACAAFFRRSLMSGMKHVCKNGDHKCKIDKSERFFCKECRFRKCVKCGMNSEKIQQNRDPISSTVQGTSGESVALENDTEQDQLPTLGSTLYDFESLLDELRKIFAQVEHTEHEDYPQLSTLGKMEWALRWIRRGQQRKHLKVARRMNFNYLTEVRCGLLKNAARWMMHSSEFRETSEWEKLMILKTSWHVWARLERLTMTVDVFEERAIREKIVFTSDVDSIYLIEVVNNGLEHLGSEEIKEVNRLLAPLFSAIFDDLAVKLLQLKPSSTEVAYMLCQMMWCVAGKTVDGKTLESGERFMDQISTDLHDYYKNDLKMHKYAIRILRMMSVVTVMQKTYIDYQKVMNESENFKKLFKV